MGVETAKENKLPKVSSAKGQVQLPKAEIIAINGKLEFRIGIGGDIRLRIEDLHSNVPLNLSRLAELVEQDYRGYGADCSKFFWNSVGTVSGGFVFELKYSGDQKISLICRVRVYGLLSKDLIEFLSRISKAIEGQISEIIGKQNIFKEDSLIKILG